MTMIACTLNHGAPIVLGDILISGDLETDRFVLPSRNEDIMPMLKRTSGLHPVWLTRKIYILKKNVCIAFAGDVSEIKKFLEDITIYCRVHEVVDGPMIQKYTMEYGFTPQHKISFLLLAADIVDDEYKFLKIQYGNWSEQDSPLFGKIISSGSGHEDFLKEAMADAQFYSGQPADSLEIVIQSNLILICKLLSAERVTLKSVEKHWGAGFEMVYLIREGFKRFEDITYVINHAIFDEKGETEIPIPEIIMHYHYVQDVLVITAINPSGGTTEVTDDQIIIRYRQFNVKQFIVEPIYPLREIDIGQIGNDTSFTSVRVAMGYVIETGTGDFMPASVNVGSALVVEYKHLQSVTITMARQHNDSIVTLSKRWFEENEMK